MTITRQPQATAAAIPDALHDLIDYEVACAYANGYQAALRDVATQQVELGEAWQPIGRRGHEERVAERIRRMEQSAAELNAQMNRQTKEGWA